MKRQKLYIVAWASGHQPPRTVYFRTTEKGWDGTCDRNQASTFKTARKARQMYDSKHLWPEELAGDWQSGVLRIEPAAIPMLPFCRCEK